MSDTPPASPPAPPPAAPAAPTTPPPAPPPEPTSTEETDWKAVARKWESRAKENTKAADELAKLKAKTMTDTEKAVAEAEARGRTAATADLGQRIAATEIKAALTGVVPDPAAVVEELNLSRFIGDDGEVDAKAVAALKAKFEALRKTDQDHGQRPTESLRRVPVAGGAEQALKTNMSDWMRDRSRSAST